jgi:uncharacterized protein YdcH (DUF465 family)
MTISEIREVLLQGDAEFQKLAQEHARYSSQLEQLTKTPYHDAEDLQLEAELKKMKLRLKDEMEKRVARFKQAS